MGRATLGWIKAVGPFSQLIVCNDNPFNSAISNFSSVRIGAFFFVIPIYPPNLTYFLPPLLASISLHSNHDLKNRNPAFLWRTLAILTSWARAQDKSCSIFLLVTDSFPINVKKMVDNKHAMYWHAIKISGNFHLAIFNKGFFPFIMKRKSISLYKNMLNECIYQ